MIKQHYTIKDFLPLIIILGVILGFSVGIPLVLDQSWMMGMRIFMGGFFVIFGLLKLIKLKSFSQAYGMYDVVAMRWPTYGFLYPFIEITLGVLFFINFQPFLTNGITLVLMTISAWGVYLKLRQKEEIMCACLGTVFKVPMTWVTLFEDIAMAVMAIIMMAFL